MTNSGSTGGSFRGLSGYLGQEDKQEWREVRNLPGRNQDEDIRLMEELASTSKADKPVYHLSLNYADGDQPTRQQMSEDADRVLSELGLADHQAVLVSHGDTDHRHLHLMVNRIHQDKPRAWKTWRDRTRVKNILGRIEQERGYELVSAGRAWDREKDHSRSNGEFMRLRKQGFEKMPLRVKADFYDIDAAIREATSWRSLQSALGEYDLKVRPKGRGGVIEDTHTGKTLKLSRVDRKHSFGKLQGRFGKFKEYEQARDMSRSISQQIPDKAIGQATARILQEGYGGRVISKEAKQQFRKAIKGAWQAHKSVKTISTLAVGGPAAAPLTWACKAVKGILRQLEHEQNRDRGLSL